MTAKVTFDTGADMEMARQNVLDFCSPLIIAQRQILPRLTFFSGEEAMMTVTSRPFNPEDVSDRNHAMRMMMFMVPALAPSLSILSMTEEISLVDRKAPSVVVIGFNSKGALAEVFPYENVDGKIIYDMEAELSQEENGTFSNYIAHMLPLFARQRKNPFSLQNMVDYLTVNHYEIEIHGEWTLSKLRSYHPS